MTDGGLRVTLSRLRSTLAAHGIKVRAVWGVGSGTRSRRRAAMLPGLREGEPLGLRRLRTVQPALVPRPALAVLTAPGAACPIQGFAVPGGCAAAEVARRRSTRLRPFPDGTAAPGPCHKAVARVQRKVYPLSMPRPRKPSVNVSARISPELKLISGRSGAQARRSADVLRRAIERLTGKSAKPKETRAN